MNFEILDDFISKEDQDMIESEMLGNNFPWYFCPATATYIPGYSAQDANTKENPQFEHIFYMLNKSNSTFTNSFKLQETFIQRLESLKGRDYFSRMIRAKANLLHKNETFGTGNYNTPHIDHVDEINDEQLNNRLETLLYYVNDSDGDTIIFNERVTDYRKTKQLTTAITVTPKKGRAILFDSSYLHSSSPPRTHNSRVVLNFVFY